MLDWDRGLSQQKATIPLPDVLVCLCPFLLSPLLMVKKCSCQLCPHPSTPSYGMGLLKKAWQAHGAGFSHLFQLRCLFWRDAQKLSFQLVRVFFKVTLRSQSPLNHWGHLDISEVSLRVLWKLLPVFSLTGSLSAYWKTGGFVIHIFCQTECLQHVSPHLGWKFIFKLMR